MEEEIDEILFSLAQAIEQERKEMEEEIDREIEKVDIFQLMKEEKEEAIESCDGGANVHLEPGVVAWAFEKFDRPWILEAWDKLERWRETSSLEDLKEIEKNFRTPYILQEIARKIIRLKKLQKNTEGDKE